MQVGAVASDRRLLTIGHSYVVASNRRLAHEMALQGGGRWRVTAVAPARFRGDLREIALEPIADEASTLRPAAIRFDRSPHLMWYADTGRVLQGEWDVVHCWEEPFVFAAAQIARAVSDRTAFVVSTFQNINKTYPWPLSAFERRVLDRADGWIAFGDTVHETMLQRRGDYRRKPSRVIPPGVDTNDFAPRRADGNRIRQQLGWSDEVPVVGFVGRFVPEKGLRVLEAALTVSKAPWHALLVGSGPLEMELKTFAAAHPGRVHIAAGVPHAEIPQWLNAMSVLCAPSQTTARWREQFGRMLIEAMACGVPVIASDSGEIPHVVGDAGVLVPEGDPAAWASAIDAVLGDERSRRGLAERGRARAETKFSWQVVARQHLEFFGSLIAGRPHGSR
jgi:glycosyltransferase involved in cell wall biosynthesis